LFEASGPLVVTRGEGVYVYDADGKRYLDAMAGLWCASLGFTNPRLAEVAASQYETLGFYHTFFGRTLPQATALAEKLVSLTGMTGGKAYFATSGSEANETMVKLAWTYHASRGKPGKRKVIARDRSFHGSTIAAASMCGLDFMHREFGLPLPGFLHTPAPYAYRSAQTGETDDAFVARLMGELEALILREGPDTIAAFIAEPIHAGGGIIVPPDSYFPAVQKVLEKYDILALADEIVCGFGRTGNWFGKDTAGYVPDMMALAKGLSAGHFPISAVVMSGPVYEAVKAFNAQGGNFGHGFTNSGHPVGVAIALEVIRIYEELDIIAHVRAMGMRLIGHFNELANEFDFIGDVRGRGLMLGMELVADRATRAPFDPELRAGPSFDRLAYQNGLVGRCMGDTLGYAPPLVVSEAEVDEIADKTRTSLKQLKTHLGR
jgi:4-aminobutyrate--pyruvate transaminase